MDAIVLQYLHRNASRRYSKTSECLSENGDLGLNMLIILASRVITSCVWLSLLLKDHPNDESLIKLANLSPDLSLTNNETRALSTDI